MKHKHIILTLFLFILVTTGFSKDKFIFSGNILDAKSGEVVKGIDVVVKDQSTGTITNKNGDFSLYLEKGKYLVTISGKGYQEQELKIELVDNINQDVSLSPVNENSKKHRKKKQRNSHHNTSLLSLL